MTGGTMATTMFPTGMITHGTTLTTGMTMPMIGGAMTMTMTTAGMTGATIGWTIPMTMLAIGLTMPTIHGIMSMTGGDGEDSSAAAAKKLGILISVTGGVTILEEALSNRNQLLEEDLTCHNHTHQDQ